MWTITLEFLFSAAGAWFVGGIALGMFVMWVPRKIRRALLRNRVRKAYLEFRNVCEPDTLNQANPGNMDFMMSSARDMANDMITRLIKTELYPPEKCTLDKKSLQEWFKFLENARIQLSTWM